MAFLPVFLWTDILIFILLAVITAGVIYIRRQPHLRAPWQQVFSRKRGVIATLILLVYVGIGLLDSVHFRSVLPQQNAEKEVFYANQVQSLFDVLVKPLKTQVEKTYSAPFATRLFSREMQLQEGLLVYGNPPLQFAGQHLLSESQKWPDVRQRLMTSSVWALGVTLLIFIVMAVFYSYRDKQTFGQTCRRWLGGQSQYPIRTLYLTLLFILLVAFNLIHLGQFYHVLGTDKVGQDVLYQALKSIRTGLVIGTLTTLVMLPLAILLGIAAGYFRGWLDDIIQYIYTTLNSIPGVLLIAAAVLMLQVYINNHPENFATAAERADIRLLFLCLILGVTSWTGLCRILRGETLKLRESEYVMAARALGVNGFTILHRHILPNLMHIVLITVVLDFSGLVLAEAVLSYVGVGVDPTMISWGNMINSARLEMARDPVVWWSLTAAFISMFVLVLAANLFADVVRDAFDPRMQASK
ncbi:MAG: ABC transporter permease [Methylophaga sp.]|nr:ABC transporter permease [Methylophaga sp.]